MVEELYVSTTQLLHHSGGGPVNEGRDEQVNVVCHQDIGMNLYVVSNAVLLQRVQVGPEVPLGTEALLPIDAALNDM